VAICTAFDPLAPYVPAVLGFVDCHARALGEEGYRALGDGSPVGMAIRGFITIYIAFIGYRMLFGDLPRMREIALAAVRIGAVLALATQWPAYQVLVYNIVVNEPTALAARILPPGGLGGEDVSGLGARIQGTYEVLDAVIYPNRSEAAGQQPSAGVKNSLTGAQQKQPLRRTLTVEETERLTSAERMLLIATLGGLLSTRIIAAVLLALGPLFIGFFLFDATRGLFVGWVRALVATIVASVGVLATLAIGLALIEPQVASLYRSMADGFSVPALVGEVSVSIGLLAVLVATTLVGTGIAAFGLRLPDAVWRSVASLGDRMGGAVPTLRTESSPILLGSSPPEERSRAQLVADAVGALDRREGARTQDTGNGRTAYTRDLDGHGQSVVAVPMGQGPNRSLRRYSGKARQRDLTT